MEIADQGRWCPRCGGETGYVRQRTAGQIRTYLACRMPSCRWKWLILIFTEETGELTELIGKRAA